MSRKDDPAAGAQSPQADALYNLACPGADPTSWRTLYAQYRGT